MIGYFLNVTFSILKVSLIVLLFSKQLYTLKIYIACLFKYKISYFKKVFSQISVKLWELTLYSVIMCNDMGS